ncbi:MAG: myxococcus cysteine-rich repeat containing protein, partial [Proteobacteria bacterium]|nr:myxococcus cysteine-rich repeat containing protein [Pseudomonadota bacterium]
MDPKRATTWAALSKTLALTILLIVLAAAAEARIVTIRWSNPEPSALTGFRVYTRAASQSSGTPAYDGMPTAVAGVYSIPLTVSDVAGTYVTATSYNTAGESARSNELFFAAPVCGNAVLDAGEQCDDGNKTAGDGCNATCQVEASCGNAVLDAGEQCDDGNKTAGDGCSATCKVEACAYGQTSCSVCSGGPAGATIYNTSPTVGKWNLAAVEIKAKGSNVVAIDAAASSAPAAAGPVTVAGFTTPTANDLIVAFVSYDASTAGAQSATVTGGGLTWSRIARSYLVGGDAEIWAATASGTLNGVSITATPAITNAGLLEVIAFKNSSGIGVSAIANASTGAASITLAGTAPGSWTFAVGMDYSNAVTRGYPAGQTMEQESTVPGVGTMWVQSTTAPSGF